MGEAKNRKHEIEALKARGKKVEHTIEERITAIVDSMRNKSSWWEETIAKFELASKRLTIAIRLPWGEIGIFESHDLIDLWNEVKVAA